ncbi:hypothetical protein GTY54_42590, partial [Streptomyces sp. SID625]|nr:hypothetical protein [Streptomyces sp. SID625]
GPTESWRPGRFTGPVVEVCTAEAASRLSSGASHEPHSHEHPDAESAAAPAPLLYNTGSERDEQVRARLAELGVAQGDQMEELLCQLAEANTAALDPDRPAALPEDDSVPGPRAARVVRERPGDAVWQVEARAYRGPAAAQPRSCAGEKVCPWRRDALAGQFPPAVSSAPRC